MSAGTRTVQVGIGKGRDPWKIRAFLSSLPGMNGRAVSMSTVAAIAETHPQVAQETINGRRNHRRVLAVLEKLGCPKEYLYGTSHPATRRAA